MYTYKALVTRVVDGDTFDAKVDVGFSTFMKHRFRLKGVDTPETWRPKCDAEREHGEKATTFVKGLIEGKEVTLVTYKMGVYARYEADVIVDDQGTDLATLLRENDLLKRDSYDSV